MYDEKRRKEQEYRDRIVKYESHLEDIFCRKVKEAGGWSIKFNSIGTNGLPDQIIFYKGITWLVELKRPQGVVAPIQLVCHKRFATHGFPVRIIRTKEEIEKFIQDMKNFRP